MFSYRTLVFVFCFLFSYSTYVEASPPNILQIHATESFPVATGTNVGFAITVDNSATLFEWRVSGAVFSHNPTMFATFHVSQDIDVRAKNADGWGPRKTLRVTVQSAPAPSIPTQPNPQNTDVPQILIVKIPPNPVYTDQTLLFEATASNSPSELEWKWGAQVVSRTLALSRRFPLGVQVVTFRARNAHGWSQQARYAFEVKTRPSGSPAPSTPSIPSTPTTPTTPSSLQPSIADVSIEKSVIRGASGAGAYIDRDFDLHHNSVIKVKRYRRLHLQASVSGGSATAYEWTLRIGTTPAIVLGRQATVQTTPISLPSGNGELRLRVQDSRGRWSAYVSKPFQLIDWPKLKFPFHGRWKWSGSSFNQNYHRGSEVGAQDWNYDGGHPQSDFGRELTACFDATVHIGEGSQIGNYVDLISGDGQFRARYYHLTTTLVQPGQIVFQGQPVGLCGNTGNSSGSHLHFVIQRRVGNRWEGEIPEPIWPNDNEVLQFVRHEDIVHSNNRRFPSNMHVIADPSKQGANEDRYGWGNHKLWALTSSSSKTVSFLDTVTVQEGGHWELWMHNPSGFTNSNHGISSHNSTSAAPFIVSVNSISNVVADVRINQAGARKGSLIKVVDLFLQPGDRVHIERHNLTGEGNKEIAFDELVLAKPQLFDNGGGFRKDGDSIRLNTNPTSGGGGGGCTVASADQLTFASAFSYFFSCIMLYLLAIIRLRPCRS